MQQQEKMKSAIFDQSSPTNYRWDAFLNMKLLNKNRTAAILKLINYVL